MRIGLIGDGGREFAIASAVKRTSAIPAELFSVCKNNNVGIREISEEVLRTSYGEKEKILEFFLKNRVETVVIGPEAPLMTGVVEYLRENGIPVVGATKSQARLEGDKSFMREFLKHKVGWGSPEWEIVKTEDEVRRFLDAHGDSVVKPIGLTGGKGVKVMGIQLQSVEDAVKYAEETIAADSIVLLEEKLVGEEFSRMAFVSGGIVHGMPLAQDFKYRYDGDKGLMTGGMGSYTYADHKMPFVTDDDLKAADRLMTEVIHKLVEETGEDYRGFLYGQFMATAKGIRLIEFNVRLGDPEAINLMSLLESDAGKIMKDIASGDISETDIRFKESASVVKYLVPRNYPAPLKEELIFDLDEKLIQDNGLSLIQASVERLSDTKWKALGSRTIGILGFGDSPEDISEKIENLLAQIQPPELDHRKDVGDRAVLQMKTEKMNHLKAM